MKFYWRWKSGVCRIGIGSLAGGTKMHKTKILISLVLAFAILIVQVGTVFAAPPMEEDPALISGTVQSITLETDPNSGMTTVLVTVVDEGTSQTVRVSLDTAVSLGLITLDGEGNPVINETALDQPVGIPESAVIPDEVEPRHPVGSALAAFFSDIPGMDYDTIMALHDEGFGFGLIAQALWLTKKLEDGDADLVWALLRAKESGDFSDFVLEDGTTPQNWGQLKKALGKAENLGFVMSNKEKENANHQNNANALGPVNGNANGHEKDKNNNGKGKGHNK